MMVASPKSIDMIMAGPFTRIRMRLADGFQGGQFSPEDFAQVIDMMKGNPHVAKELPNVLIALQTGTAPEEPNINRPETQLLWAAAFTYLNANLEAAATAWPDERKAETLAETPLWRQLSKCPRARFELVQNAYHISESITNPDTKIGWGDPGSWFYFAPAQNRINMDLLFSLIAGFEHTRSVMFHEIGHSQLTVAWPPSMVKLRKQMEDLQKLAKTRELTRDEYVQLNLWSVEWNLRHQLFNSAEDNVVNRYTANKSARLAQDYGYSLNHISASVAGTGRAYAAREAGQPAPDDSAQARFSNLCHAVNMSFFQNNELTRNTAEGWSKIGVKPEWVGTDQTPSDQPGVFGGHDFRRLLELCRGEQGLENLQPAHKDRLFGKAYYDALVEKLANKRNAIVEQIWDEYAADLVKSMMEEAKKQIEEQLDNPDKNQKGEKGKGQKGPKGQGGGQGGGEGGDDSDDSDDNDNDSQGQGQGGKKGNKPGKPGQGGGQGDDSDGDDAEKGDKTVPVEGAGDQPNPDLPPESPNGKGKGKDKGKDKGKGKDAGDGSGDGADDDETIGDLTGDKEDGPGKDKGKDADGKDADGKGKEKGQKGDKGGKEGQGQGNGQGQGGGKGAGNGGGGKGLDDLARGDWSDYLTRVRELQAPINMVAVYLKKLRDHQVETQVKMSRDKDLLPIDGEALDRLDRKAHEELIRKRNAGEQLDEKDYKRFRVDETKTKPTKVELMILIDGSGSMNMRSGGATRLEQAILSAVILYEAARQLDMNVYIGMWGNENPPIIAKPGDDPKLIGKAIESVRRGLNSGTDLTPAIKKAVRAMAEQRGDLDKPIGYSHMMIISDGDIMDVRQAKQTVETLFHATNKVTIDVGVIGAEKTSVDELAKKVRAKNKIQEMGVVHELQADKITLSVVNVVLQKLRLAKSFAAVPTGAKRRELKKATRQVERKP